jgi:hypothetical protein
MNRKQFDNFNVAFNTKVTKRISPEITSHQLLIAHSFVFDDAEHRNQFRAGKGATPRVLITITVFKPIQNTIYYIHEGIKLTCYQRFKAVTNPLDGNQINSLMRLWMSSECDNKS